MKFAKFWTQKNVAVDESFFGRSQVTIWGASNKDIDEAARNADSRVKQFQNMLSSGAMTLEDYEYWNGYIKEEVVEELKADDGSTLAVLTRNNYGALVLNSESVFFGDIDISESNFVARILELFGKEKKNKAYYLAKVEAFQKTNSHYTFKVYETFAGLRVAITNHIFATDSTETQTIFKALNTDPLYVQLCKNQACFRARLSPKPWRLGLERPRTRFPRNDRRDQNDFADWLRHYQQVSQKFTTVKLLATFGTAVAHTDVGRILSIHDKHAISSSSDLA